MSKEFKIIITIIVGGLLITYLGMKQSNDLTKDYDSALRGCGLNMDSGFSDEELLVAQKCACSKGDKMSCGFVQLQSQ
jgi:hypothetical protein